MNRRPPLAITGISAHLPGIDGVHELTECFSKGADNRQRIQRSDSNPAHVPWQRRIENANAFDAAFFNMGQQAASLVDPQQRLLAQTVFNALDQAGAFEPDRICSLTTSVSISSYLNEQLLPALDRNKPDEVSRAILLNDKDNVAQHLGYLLGLSGPFHNRQAACASAILGIEQAWEDLEAGRCDTAVVAAASVNGSLEQGTIRRPGVFSRDGHCRAFSRRADGTASGDGVLAIVLRPLDTALAAGDTIWACLRACAVGHSGNDRNDFLAPDPRSYAEVMQSAIQNADLTAGQVSFVEAHGTGIPWQDAAELEALAAVYAQAHAHSNQPCLLGSSKANLGHLDAAAALLGVVRAALALKRGRHFPTPFADESVQLAEGLQLPAEEGSLASRFVAVNAFAANGTNAHLILEAPPLKAGEETADNRTQSKTSLCTLSAADPERLKIRLQRLASALRKLPESARINDLAFSLGNGRRSFACRFAAAVASKADLIAALEQLHTDPSKRPLFWMFPGMGDLADDMIPQFADQFPSMQAELHHCAHTCVQATGVDLLPLLFPPQKPDANSGDSFRDWIKAARAREKTQSRYEHLRLFAFEVSLGRLLLKTGMQPQALIGYSTGEYVAACLAEVLTLEECFRLLHRRIELLQDAETGALTAVPLDATQLNERLPADLAISALQGAFYNIVGGARNAVEQFETEMEAEDIACRRLAVTHAFHTPLMEPLLDRYRETCSRIPTRAPKIPILSTLTGQPLDNQQALNPEHWVQHMRQPVRIDESLTAALRSTESNAHFLEIGPGQHLSGLVQRHPEKSDSTQIHATTALPISNDTHPQTFLRSIASILPSINTPLNLNPIIPPAQRLHLEASPVHPQTIKLP